MEELVWKAKLGITLNTLSIKEWWRTPAGMDVVWIMEERWGMDMQVRERWETLAVSKVNNIFKE